LTKELQQKVMELDKLFQVGESWRCELKEECELVWIGPALSVTIMGSQSYDEEKENKNNEKNDK